MPDGGFVALPLTGIAVQFDQAMWTGEPGADADTRAADPASALNPGNFRFVGLGINAGETYQPTRVQWDAQANRVVIDTTQLPAGQWQLEMSSGLQNALQMAIGHTYVSSFTAVTDMTHRVRLTYTATRADRANGTVSYDVNVTNIGDEDLVGPLTLLLDPQFTLGGAVLGATPGTGLQEGLWLLDLSAGLTAFGNKLPAGGTLMGQTVTLRPATAVAPGLSELVKANPLHGIFAVPQANMAPVLGLPVVDPEAAPDEPPLPIELDWSYLGEAPVGSPWEAALEAVDADGTRLFWQLVSAPAGVSLEVDDGYTVQEDGYHHTATLRWTPDSRSPAEAEVVVRIQDSRGGVATRRFYVDVPGGNSTPFISYVDDVLIEEGQLLELPVNAGDAEGDRLTFTVENLPPGAVFDALRNRLVWTPGYDQAGVYDNVTVVVSDGLHTVRQTFKITVDQTRIRPELSAIPAQTLREGQPFGIQLHGSMPGARQIAPTVWEQEDGTRITLEYYAAWLPAGATLNPETGWLSWTPGYAQHGDFTVPITLIATQQIPGRATPVVTKHKQDLVMQVLNANGEPQFADDLSSPWTTLEGQPLRISLFAMDPDNPDFEPRFRLSENGALAESNTDAPATVSYHVTGLPPGARFDADTLELIWTPGYTQAGTYYVQVTATDNGDGTGVPASATALIPIVVENANRAPQIGDLQNVILDKGAVLEIPVNVTDADGNPLDLVVSGLPAFATYTRNPSADGVATGVIRLAPGEGQRGDYTLTVTARDNGDGQVNQVQTVSKSFVVTVRSLSEAPVLTAPTELVAVAGQWLSLPLSVSDADQDALSWSVSGLPAGAQLLTGTAYGQAVLQWAAGSG